MGDYADDALFDGLMGDDGWGMPRLVKRTHKVTCKYCGMRGLKWRSTEAGWVLTEKRRADHNRKVVHNCRVAAASGDDFDVLE